MEETDKIVLAIDLERGDVIRFIDEGVVIEGTRHSRVWPNMVIISYRYLGQTYINEALYQVHEQFTRITKLGVLA